MQRIKVSFGILKLLPKLQGRAVKFELSEVGILLNSV